MRERERKRQQEPTDTHTHSYSAFSPPVKPQSFLLERCPGRPSDERIQTAIQNIGAVAHGDDLLVAMSRAVRVVPAGTDTLYRVFLSEINLTRHTRLHLAVRVAMNLVLIVYFLVTLPAFLWDVVGIRLLYVAPAATRAPRQPPNRLPAATSTPT